MNNFLQDFLTVVRIAVGGSATLKEVEIQTLSEFFFLSSDFFLYKISTSLIEISSCLHQ